MNWLERLHCNPCKGIQILDKSGKSIYRQRLFPWVDPERVCLNPNGQIAETVNRLFERIAKYNPQSCEEFSIVLGRNRWDPDPWDPSWPEKALRQERLDTEKARRLFYSL